MQMGERAIIQESCTRRKEQAIIKKLSPAVFYGLLLPRLSVLLCTGIVTAVVVQASERKNYNEKPETLEICMGGKWLKLDRLFLS